MLEQGTHRVHEVNWFTQSVADPCIYVRDENSLSIVAVYVDDLIIATKTDEDMQATVPVSIRNERYGKITILFRNQHRSQ